MTMRPILGLILLASSFALLAVAPSPSPAPVASPGKPLVTPKPAATPFSSNAPVVLIYPFEVQGSLPANVGVQIAQLYVQQFEAAGGTTALSAGTDVKRENYLTHARAVHADYYISGYLTPVGDGAAFVEQVVSVDSGIILTSQTAQIVSAADATAQALQAHTIITELANRGTADVAPQDASTAAPTGSSTSNGAQVPLSGIGGALQSLFKGHAKANATPTPAPAAAKPSRGVIVAHVDGTLPASDLTTATTVLQQGLEMRFHTQLANANEADVAKNADKLCGTNRNNTIAAGKLTTQPSGKNRTENVFTLTVYTCFGAPLYTVTKNDARIAAAITAAIDAYITDHPTNS